MKDLKSLHTHTAPEVIEYLEGLETRVAALEEKMDFVKPLLPDSEIKPEPVSADPAEDGI